MEYISLVEYFLWRVEESFYDLKECDASGINGLCDWVRVLEIKGFMDHAYRQIKQIRDRKFYDQKIPHGEKAFSIFEGHTQWISKGKAGVPQELGLPVCIVEDQYHFVLHHRVMEKETDEMVAVSMVRSIQEKFKGFESCSFDKGFYSPGNQEALNQLLETSILPKKGRLSVADKEIAGSKEFIKGRQQHSGVESAINALENHGLDRCLDHGINGFKRYVGLAVLSRNIHVLGTIVHKKKVKALKRRNNPRNQSQRTPGQKVA